MNGFFNALMTHDDGAATSLSVYCATAAASFTRTVCMHVETLRSSNYNNAKDTTAL
jgi:hypothetical protein